MMMMMVVVEMMVMEMMVMEMMVVEMMVMMIMGGGYLLHLSYNAMVYELVAHTVKSQIELPCLFSVTPEKYRKGTPRMTLILASA